LARPQSTLVVSTTTPGTTTTTGILEGETTKSPKKEQKKPIVDRLHIQSDIQFRYAKTVVESYVKNPSISNSQEVEFEIVLPEKAFISNFTIQTQGKTYVSRVEKKEEAKKVYQEAVEQGQTAGLVDAREGNNFAVKTNVAPAEKLTFTLTYEQLLERVQSRYEQIINLNPGQIVNDLEINVHINESLPVININVPELKQKSNELTEDLADNPVAIIRGENTSLVDIAYRPSAQYQRDLNKDGVSGQFIIQYDVDRKNQSSDIQLYDGYLVHFFVPENDREMLPKHVTFVLDTSGSMSGEKITQLQDAMVTILSNLNEQDHFSIIEFATDVKHWQSLAEQEESTSEQPIYPANQFLIEEAIDYAVGLEATSSTNINDALLEALEVSSKAKRELKSNTVAIIIFLTDGQPTVGVTNSANITANVKSSNDLNIPIYGLAFGRGADFNLVKGISEDSRAFARKIFEGSDATIQLENFYAEISSPLLSNVTFQYVGENLQTAENVHPGSTFNSGSEFVSVVKLPDAQTLPESISVNGLSSTRYDDIIYPCFPIRPVPYKGDLNATSERPHILEPHFPCIPPPLPPQQKREVNFIERLWAFLTIEKLLDDKADNGNTTEEERKEKATDLALEYNFVTDLTSLVVVKPSANDTEKDESVTGLTPVSQLKEKSFFGGSNFHTFRATSYSAYGAPAPPPPGMRTAVFKSGSRNRARPQSFNHFLGGHMGPTTTTPRTTTTFGKVWNGTVQHSLDSWDNYDDYDYDTATTTTATPCVPTDCKVELFSRTLFRGDSVTLTAGSLDLNDFDNKLESLRVSGNCKWTLFTEKDHQGVSQSFLPGDYKNAATLRKVLRKASSAEVNECL